VITYSEIDLTPGLAREYLDTQAPNRPKKLAKVRQFARDMTAGNWRFTGEAIKFNDRGQMIDGQNRCQAVIDSGVTIRVLVIRGLEHETQSVMDSGTPRNTRDALFFGGYENTKDLAAAITAHTAWLSGAFAHCMSGLNYHVRPTNSEMVEYADTNPGIIEAVKTAKGIYSQGLRLPVGAIAVALIETRKISPADSEEFFDRIVNLRTEGRGDPVQTLVKRVAAIHYQGHRPALAMGPYLLFRSWNAFRAGETLTKFQIGAPARDGGKATWAQIPEPR
jgi:hypothetical protein